MTEPAVTNPTPTGLDNPPEPPPSYVKLAMRNMVKKGGKAIFHFSLTAVALVSFFVGLAYLTR